jgi:hypothetical protein
MMNETGSPSNLVKKAHQQDILKTFIVKAHYAEHVPKAVDTGIGNREPPQPSYDRLSCPLLYASFRVYLLTMSKHGMICCYRRPQEYATTMTASFPIHPNILHTNPGGQQGDGKGH